jgi:hypothetical protein
METKQTSVNAWAIWCQLTILLMNFIQNSVLREHRSPALAATLAKGDGGSPPSLN